MVLDAFTCGRIYQLMNADKKKKPSLAEIARQVGHSRVSVRAVVRRHFQSAPFRRKVPVKVLQRRRELTKLASKVKKVEHRSFPQYGCARQLRAGLKEKTGEVLSTRQVQREMKAAGMKPYVRQVVPTRTPADLRKRKAFGKRMRSICPKLRKRICFSDESWLSCAERTGRGQYARNRKLVLPLERKARWNTPSILVWACVGFNYKSELIIFPSKRTVEGEIKPYRLNSSHYVMKCLSKVVPAMLAGRKLFQQDGARAHIAKNVCKYLRGKGVNWIMDWPPYSPDLSAVESCWKELNSRVGARCPMSQQELIRVAKEEWDNMPQSLINKHVRHFETLIRTL